MAFQTHDGSERRQGALLGYDQPGIGIIGAYEGGNYTSTRLPSFVQLEDEIHRTAYDAVGREQFILEFYELRRSPRCALAASLTLTDTDEFLVDRSIRT